MPDNIPNPFYQSSPLGDALKNLSATIMSGPTDAQRIFQAEQALKAQTQRLGTDAYATNVLNYGQPGYTPQTALAAGIKAGVTPENVAQSFRFLAPNVNGVNSPEATAAYVGAGGAMSSSPAGFATDQARQIYEFQNKPQVYGTDTGPVVGTVASAIGKPAVEPLANVQGNVARVAMAAPGGIAAAPPAIQHMVGAYVPYNSTPEGVREVTNRQVNQQQYQFDNTFETMRAPDGQLVPVARNKVADAVSRGYTVQPSTDQVKAGIIQQSLPGAPQAAAPGAPTAQPNAVSSDPNYNLPPSVQHFMGINTAPVPMVDPRNNRSGLSYDGGRSVVNQTTGQVEQVAGGGWIPAGPETAVGESRTALAKSQAGTPTQFPPWDQGSYAQSAGKTSGVASFAQEHTNALLGALGLNNAVPGGELGPSYERARERLGIVNQNILSAFMNSPTSPIKEQSRIRDLLPTDAIFQNSVTEANKVGTLVSILQDDNTRLRGLISNPGITGTLMTQAQQALIANEKALGMMTAPAQSAAQAPATAQPPTAGARQAPDGNWYVSDPSRPGKYLMVQKLRYNPSTGQIE